MDFMIPVLKPGNYYKKMTHFTLDQNHKSDKLDKNPYIFNDDKKAVFIKNYVNSVGKVTDACKKTRIARDTYYRALKSDEEFARKIEEADDTICDDVEALMVEYDIKDPKKFAARKFWLERHSDKYKN